MVTADPQVRVTVSIFDRISAGSLAMSPGSDGVSHTKIESTVRYLGIDVDDALAIAEQIDV